MCHFEIFYKINSFLKSVSNILDRKKGRFAIINLHIIVGQLFFSSTVDYRRKNSQAEETI